jgi:deoxyribodipyrimidine photo-lyase
MSSPGTIVWLRQDLRLRDNPALAAALERGGWILPLYILCQEEEGDWPAGAASRWWLHESLAALEAALNQRGSRLLLQRGRALDVIRELVKHSGADAVYWNRRYEPAAIARDSAIKQALRGDGVATASFNGALLAEPWDVRRMYRLAHCIRRTVDASRPNPLAASPYTEIIAAAASTQMVPGDVAALAAW